ncbi:hypothetical protein BJX99DRAFT_65844 [Aspergillus californicus]
MDTTKDTKSPRSPAQIHLATASPTHDYDYESQRRRPKTIRTWGDSKREWNNGSKFRVIRYYLLYVACGFIVGGIVGAVIGVIIRFT